MKTAYPVIISKGKRFLIASVPDCQIDTQGESLVDVIEMARDAISIWCVSEQDDGRELPPPSDVSDISCDMDEIVTLVDIDLDAYRRKHENRAVKKTLTIPSWLNEKAEQSGINFSQTLQSALIEKLEV